MSKVFMTLKEKWNSEYINQGIPSSIRRAPSHSLINFLDFISQPVLDKKLLDIGCGKGRNAVYAAKQGLQVTAVDFVEQNIVHIKNNQESYPGNLDAICIDITNDWPFSDNYFDFAYDAFCFKHIIELPKRKHYVAELARVLKNRQYVAISLADINDGYYGQFLCQGSSEQHLIIDPQNHIPSILYTYDTFQALFDAHFKVVTHHLKQSTSDMYGKSYDWYIHEFIVQNKK